MTCGDVTSGGPYSSVAGLFTPDEGMADSLTAAAKASGEKFWQGLSTIHDEQTL